MRHALAIVLLVGSSACVEEVPVLFPHDAGTPPVVTGGAFLSLGDRHTCEIRGGTLRCWGDGRAGQLGVGALPFSKVPSLVDAGSDFVSVAAAEESTCALRRDGTVWCTGGNGRGQLGLGDLVARKTFERVTLPGAALSLASNHATACVVLADRRGFCWGDNLEGQIGLQDSAPGADQLSPQQVTGAQRWQLIATGQGHTCGLEPAGSLWCWGRNDNNHLGIGAGTPGQVRQLTRVGTRTDWRTIISTQEGSCAIDQLDKLWCWGGTYEELTNSPPAPDPVFMGDGRWRDFSVETFHGCGVQRDGTLWCTGRGIEGQLGLGDLNPRTMLTRVGTDSDWSEVQCGRFHTCARKNNGSLFCTGENANGELGLGDLVRRNVFTLVQ